MEEHQKELSNILGINKFDSEFGYTSKKSSPASWAEIYEAIGALKEKANKPPRPEYIFKSEPMPLMNDNPNKHYHNGSVCYNNPCFWC